MSLKFYPTSFIQHPTSYIQHPASYIRYPASYIQHPASYIMQAFHILHPISSILHLTPCRHSTSCILFIPKSVKVFSSRTVLVNTSNYAKYALKYAFQYSILHVWLRITDEVQYPKCAYGPYR